MSFPEREVKIYSRDDTNHGTDDDQVCFKNKDRIKSLFDVNFHQKYPGNISQIFEGCISAEHGDITIVL